MINDDSNTSQLVSLTSRQSAVQDLLKRQDTEKYHFSEWYYAALFAIDNTRNPDRFSQAAQSLRELLEKLQRTVQGSDVQAPAMDFKGHRRRMHERFQKDKNRYEDSWKGEKIDDHLAKTIREFGHYLESNQQPTRKEKIQRTVDYFDPMSNVLSNRAREQKRDRLHKLQGMFENVAHHNHPIGEKEFREYVEKFESFMLNLLAPVTAQDQLEIESILARQYRTREDTDRLFSLIDRVGANYMLFFRQVSDSSWMNDLNQRGYFSEPPSIEILSESRVNLPYWAPIDYLVRIANQHTKGVVDTVLEMGHIDNPLILNGIAKIALKVTPIEQSLRLKEYIIEYMDSPYTIDQSNIIPKLIERWFGKSDDATNVALKLAGKIVSFQPDPKMEEKISRHEENPNDWTTILNPTPRFISGNYHKFLKNNICPLAKKNPWKLASILIDEVARMNRLYHYPANSDQKTRSDYSRVWCPRLGKLIWKHDSPEQAIINTLTYTCGILYELAPEHIGNLNEKLANQPWPLFKRLRQYLCAHNLTAQTKPWIRELILNHPDYARWDYPYDFQQMLRRACERFGEELLTKEERIKIFGAIQSGPSKDAYRTVLGGEFTEDIFRQRRQKFHQMQFRPFATVLFGKYLDYFKELETTLNEPISDEDYSPAPEVGSRIISYRSPKSPEDLANLRDEKLLDYINVWQGQHDLELDRTMEVSIDALSGAFQNVFMETIIPDENRLSFWLENRNRIQRPIYVRVMVDAMQASVKAKKFVHIDRWLDFCKWVLSHPDSHSTETFPFGEGSRETPGWTTSRRSVVDFIATCLGEDVDTPISARSGLANLLQSLCTQPDWTLDQEEHGSDDLVSVAINRTRGRALDGLIDFGVWIRRHEPRSDVPEIAAILNNRFSQNETLPITLPEYAILGIHYFRITLLNPVWAQERRADIFPHDNFPVWRAAFSAFIRYAPVRKELYHKLQAEYRFAIEHLEKLPPEQHKYGVDIANLEALIPDSQERESRRNEIIDKLGHHLFIYYLWGMFSFNDKESLLNLFYEKTRDNPEYWRDLFGYAGRLLKVGGETWGDKMIAKAMEFFDWRFAERNPEELQEFPYWWLEAECLPAKWRLDVFSQILDICQPGGGGIMHGVSTLAEMLEEHPGKVVECFAKMTNLPPRDDYIYIDTGKAEKILKSGYDSNDENTRQHAECAHDKLLKHGYSVSSQLGD